MDAEELKQYQDFISIPGYEDYGYWMFEEK